jgi:uncharacterized protein with PIN domain
VSDLEELTFFVDRALGKKYIPDMLRAAGYRVEVHDDHFDKAASDVDWVPAVASRGWIILTKDEKIA